jgi:hypothetical protein
MQRSSTPSRPWTLEFLIPLTLTIAVLAGLALQFMPLERLAFRSQEALIDPNPAGGPYLPDRRYRNDRSYGDLAQLGNFPSLRQYRLESFTTDHWGYRNSPPTVPDPAAAILIGDSFGVAVGVEDSETLSAQLGRLWERSVYNASGMRRVSDVAQILSISHRLGMRGGLVIHEFLERQDAPPVPPLSPRAAVSAKEDPSRREFSKRLREIWRACRLRILAERAYRHVQDDRILPNTYRSQVVLRRLLNGKEILFLASDLEARAHHRPVKADYWVWLRKRLGDDGLRLVVLLVPNKYTVYGPLLVPPASSDEPGSDYLETLERKLRSQGIDVVNLETVFRARARQDLSGGAYLYWLDDTHWTGRGMNIAAREIVRAFPSPDAGGASPAIPSSASSPRRRP